MKEIVFAGVDEVTEIAYLSLRETNLKLAGVVEMECSDSTFFGYAILPINSIQKFSYDCIIVTSYLKQESIYRELVNNGIDKKDIRTFTTG